VNDVTLFKKNVRLCGATEHTFVIVLEKVILTKAHFIKRSLPDGSVERYRVFARVKNDLLIHLDNKNFT